MVGLGRDFLKFEPLWGEKASKCVIRVFQDLSIQKRYRYESSKETYLGNLLYLPLKGRYGHFGLHFLNF